MVKCRREKGGEGERVAQGEDRGKGKDKGEDRNTEARLYLPFIFFLFLIFIPVSPFSPTLTLQGIVFYHLPLRVLALLLVFIPFYYSLTLYLPSSIP